MLALAHRFGFRLAWLQAPGLDCPNPLLLVVGIRCADVAALLQLVRDRLAIVAVIDPVGEFIEVVFAWSVDLNLLWYYPPSRLSR